MAHPGVLEWMESVPELAKLIWNGNGPVSNVEGPSEPNVLNTNKNDEIEVIEISSDDDDDLMVKKSRTDNYYRDDDGYMELDIEDIVKDIEVVDFNMSSSVAAGGQGTAAALVDDGFEDGSSEEAVEIPDLSRHILKIKAEPDFSSPFSITTDITSTIKNNDKPVTASKSKAVTTPEPGSLASLILPPRKSARAAATSIALLSVQDRMTTRSPRLATATQKIGKKSQPSSGILATKSTTPSTPKPITTSTTSSSKLRIPSGNLSSGKIPPSSGTSTISTIKNLPAAGSSSWLPDTETLKSALAAVVTGATTTTRRGPTTSVLSQEEKRRIQAREKMRRMFENESEEQHQARLARRRELYRQKMGGGEGGGGIGRSYVRRMSYGFSNPKVEIEEEEPTITVIPSTTADDGITGIVVSKSVNSVTLPPTPQPTSTSLSSSSTSTSIYGETVKERDDRLRRQRERAQQYYANEKPENREKRLARGRENYRKKQYRAGRSSAPGQPRTPVLSFPVLPNTSHYSTPAESHRSVSPNGSTTTSTSNASKNNPNILKFVKVPGSQPAGNQTNTAAVKKVANYRANLTGNRKSHQKKSPKNRDMNVRKAFGGYLLDDEDEFVDLEWEKQRIAQEVSVSVAVTRSGRKCNATKRYLD